SQAIMRAKNRRVRKALLRRAHLHAPCTRRWAPFALPIRISRGFHLRQPCCLEEASIRLLNPRPIGFSTVSSQELFPGERGGSDDNKRQANDGSRQRGGPQDHSCTGA